MIQHQTYYPSPDPPQKIHSYLSYNYQPNTTLKKKTTAPSSASRRRWTRKRRGWSGSGCGRRRSGWSGSASGWRWAGYVYICYIYLYMCVCVGCVGGVKVDLDCGRRGGWSGSASGWQWAGWVGMGVGFVCSCFLLSRFFFCKKPKTNVQYPCRYIYPTTTYK